MAEQKYSLLGHGRKLSHEFHQMNGVTIRYTLWGRGIRTLPAGITVEGRETLVHGPVSKAKRLAAALAPAVDVLIEQGGADWSRQR